MTNDDNIKRLLTHYRHPSPARLPDGRTVATDCYCAVVWPVGHPAAPAGVASALDMALLEVGPWARAGVLRLAVLNTRVPPCERCAGLGVAIALEPVRCGDCGGDGSRECDLGHKHKCETCSGTGQEPLYTGMAACGCEPQPVRLAHVHGTYDARLLRRVAFSEDAEVWGCVANPPRDDMPLVWLRWPCGRSAVVSGLRSAFYPSTPRLALDRAPEVTP